MTATKTPTEKGPASAPSAPVGTAPGPLAGPVMGEREPDASPQVSPSRTHTGEDGGPGASDAVAAPPVAGQILRCACSHVETQHSDFTGHCQLLACGCSRWRPSPAECPFCAGSGVDHDEEGLQWPCPACDGATAVTPGPPAVDDSAVCACCLGAGWCCAEPDGHLICAACAGTGSAPLDRRPT